MLRTVDGGSSWTPVPVLTTNDILAVTFPVDGTIGYAVGKKGTIARTSNSGSTWAFQSLTADKLLGVSFPIDVTVGYAAGRGGTLLKTTNGGASWLGLPSGTTVDLYDIEFPADVFTGWTAGKDGFIHNTTNGGSSWNAQASGTTEDLFAVDFADNANGWTVGKSGTIVATGDGGSSWSPQTSGVTKDLQSVHFPVDALTGYIAGQDGTILKTTNGGAAWATQSTPTTEDLFGIHFADAATGYAAGKNATILKTTNGGSTWSTIVPPSGATFLDVHFVDALTGWVVDTDGLILGTADGGSSWASEPSSTTDALRAIDFGNPVQGFSVGDGPLIIARDDPAANSPPVADPISDQLPDEGDIVSLAATATDSNGDGLTWTQDSGPGAVDAAGNYSWITTEADGPGTYTVLLRVTDDGVPNTWDTVSFDITVAEVNVAPVLDPVGPQSGDEKTLIGFTATASDADIPGNGLTFTLEDGPGSIPPGAAITSGGAFTWTPTEAQGPGLYTFDVAVTDDGTPNLEDRETITITVDDVNEAPTGIGLVPATVAENVPVATVVGTLSSVDPDPGDSHSYALVAGAGDTDNGLFTIVGDELRTNAALDFEALSSPLSVRVETMDSGAGNLTFQESLSVSLTDVNEAPTANNDAAGASEDAFVVVNVKVNDTDPEDGIPGGPASVVVEPLHGSAVANVDGQGTITYTPDPDFYGQDQFTYTIDDSGGETSLTATVTVTVTGSDDPPAATDDGPFAMLEDATLGVGAHDFRFEFEWGSPGSGDAQFSGQRGIAVASDESVYVVDTGNDRVQKFDADGNYLLQWGTSGTGNGQFDTPFGLAVADDGTVYVADGFNDRIQYFDPNGAYLGQFGGTGTGDGQLDSPRTLDFGPDGNLYVADTYNYRIQVFTPTGTFLRKWGSFGTGNGQFDAPRGLAVSNLGIVYVADSFNDRVQYFDSFGTYLGQWGSTGTANGQFDFPRAVELDAAGNVYVADSFNNRIQVFDDSGGYVASFGAGGTGPGEFNGSYGIAFAPDGSLYVGDIGNSRIERFVSRGILTNDLDPDLPGDALTVSVFTDVSNGTLALNPDGSFTYDPDPDYFGPDSFVYQVCDTTPTCDTATVTIVVDPVNDVPLFAAGSNAAVFEDNGLSAFPGWATAIAAGPANESAQSLAFNVTGNTNPGLFSVAPAVDSATGDLTFTPAANANGASSITIELQDNGGTANGGADTSGSTVFTISVGSVNDAPSFTAGGDVTVDEDSGAYDVLWAAAMSEGPADESGQLLGFNVTGNTNPGLFSVVPAVDAATGNLSFTPAADANGSADITVELQDDGGVANGGDDTSGSVVFTITVDAVNDEPSFVSGGNITVSEDSGAYSAPWASSILPGPANEGGQTVSFNTTGNTNPGLFSVSPVVDGSGTLTFTLASNANGVASITIEAQDNGGVANGGNDTSAPVVVTITVDPVNDPPVLDPIGPQSGDEGTVIGFNATASDIDIPAETLTFTLEDGPGSIPGGAAITAGGVFSWTPTEAQGPGVYTFDVVVTDDGAGLLEDRETITVTVGEVNESPALASPGDQISAEGEAVSLTVVVADPDLPENSFTFAASGLPPGLTINGSTGEITGLVGAGAAAGSPYSVTIDVDDDGAPVLSDSVAFAWTVVPNTLSVAKSSDVGGIVLEGDTITYTIDVTNVGGVAQTNVTITDPLPAGTSFVSSQVDTTTTGTFRDEFDAVSYAGSNGTEPWTGAWQELGEADGPSSGRARVVASTRCLAANCFRIGGDEVSITGRGVLREADLSAADTATLTLSSRRQRIDDGGGSVTLEISGNGGFSWDALKTWNLTASDSTQVADEFDITAYRAVDTQIRLVGSGEAESYLYIDNVTISAGTAATAAGGPPPAITSGHVLDPGESLTVTLVVTVDDPVADATTQIVNTATATSGEGASAADNATDNVNFRPRATNPGNQSGAEGTPVSLFVAAYDPGGDSLTWSQTGLPVGLFINPGTGEISGTPTFASAGSYTVTVTVTDDGTPNLATNVVFDWDIVDTNRPPVADAIADRFPDEGDTVGLTATATDPDGDGLTWSLDSGPGGVLSNGDYTWVTSEADGPGTYTVVLRVTDDGSPSLDDTVSFDITVSEVSVAPVLDPVGAQSGDEGTVIGFTATASDVDVPDALTFSLEDGAGLVPGGAVITAGGVFSWTPTEAQGPGVYTFDVVVTDDGTPNLTDRETITVTVNEANLAPVADPVVDVFPDEGDTVSLTATATDADTPPNSLTWTLDSGPGVVLASGDYTWVTTEADGPGTYTVVLRVTDDGLPNLDDTVSFDITVGEVNVAPLADPVADQLVDEGDTVSLTASASDPDLPSNTLTWSRVAGPGSVTAGGDFAWSTSEADGPGTYTVILEVSDGTTTDTVSFDATVNEVNVAPVLDPVGAQAGDEGIVIGFTATGSDTDLPANGLTFSVEDGAGSVPPGASIAPGGVFTWTPTETQGPGVYSFDVVVTDAGAPNLEDRETITVTVGEVDTPPTLDPVGNRLVDEGSPLVFVASSSDPDLPGNRTYRLEDGVGLVPPGAVIDPLLGLFGWTPTEAQGPGSYTFDVVVSDNTGLEDRETITVTVNEVNDAPLLDPIGDQAVDELTLLSFTATASDTDLPPNTLTFSLVGEPPGAAITSDGAFSWMPSEAQGPGVYSFDVIVTDDGALTLSDYETITIAVANVNSDPVLSPIGDQSVDEDALLTFTAAASDADIPSETLTFSLLGAPAGASIDPTVGAFAWTATETQGPGVYTFEVVVTDPSGGSDRETITVTIGEVNYGPTLTDPGPQVSGEGLGVVLTLDGSDDDVPANGLIWSATGLPAGLGIDATTGEISGIIPMGEAAGSPYGVSVELTDDGSPARSATVDFEWTVIANTAPVAAADFYEVGPGGTLSIATPGVFANDTDPDGDAFVATVIVPPSAGELSLSADGGFTYSHNGGGTVEDVFVYEIDDGRGGLALGTAKISILEPNLPPVLAADLLTMLEDGVGTVAPLLNDSDPNGDAISLLDFDQPEAGLLVAVDGVGLTYTPPADFFGEVSAGYTVVDENGATATGLITIVVAPVNDQPLGQRDALTLDAYRPYVVDVLANDQDVDGDRLRVVDVLGGQVGGVELNGDGTITYRPATGFVGTDTFEYIVDDGAGGVDTVLVAITVPEQALATAIARGEQIGSPTLGFQAPEADLARDRGTNIGFAQGVSLMADAFFQSLGALRLPILFLGFAVGTVVVLGGFTELPLLLATRRRRYYSVVLLDREHRLAARQAPDFEAPATYFYEATAAGFRSVDKPTVKNGRRWIPVETPNGDAWVETTYVTEAADLQYFLDDEKPVAMLRQLADDLLGRKDISSLFSDRGFAIALTNDPEIIPSANFREALADRYASPASTRLWGEVLEPLGVALRAAEDLDTRSSHSRTALIPVELWNFQYLAVNAEGHPPWLVYFEYQKGKPRIVGVGVDV
ncbi:MAG: tandem-95 repeat protein [Acidimicrobiia bacterium]|nr:tandem-95 repeat protein [Acidimicrobiia bacterium]